MGEASGPSELYVIKIYQPPGGNGNAVGRSKRAVRASWLYVTSPRGDVTLFVTGQHLLLGKCIQVFGEFADI